MQHVNDAREADRVDCSVGVAVIVIHYFDYARPPERRIATERLRIGMLLSDLCQIEAETKNVLNVFRERPQVRSR